MTSISAFSHAQAILYWFLSILTLVIPIRYMKELIMRFLDQPPLVDSHVEFIQLPIDSSDDTDLVMSSSGFDNSKDLPKTTSEFIVEIQSPITASNCFTTTNSQSTNEYDPSSVLVIKEEKTISEIPPTASPKGRFRDGIYKKEKSEDEPGFTNPVSQLTETELETKCRLEKCIASLNIQTSKPAVIYDAIREIQSTLSSDRALRINLKEIKLASSLMRFLKTLNRSPPHLRLAHICLALINDVMVIPEVKPTMFLRPKSAEFWVQRLQSYGKHEDLLINCLKTIIYGCEEPQFLKSVKTGVLRRRIQDIVHQLSLKSTIKGTKFRAKASKDKSDQMKLAVKLKKFISG